MTTKNDDMLIEITMEDDLSAEEFEYWWFAIKDAFPGKNIDEFYIETTVKEFREFLTVDEDLAFYKIFLNGEPVKDPYGFIYMGEENCFEESAVSGNFQRMSPSKKYKKVVIPGLKTYTRKKKL